MASAQERFDFEKVRHEINKHPRTRRIHVTINFVAETARILREKGKLKDFVLIADRSIELLQGNLALKRNILFKLTMEFNFGINRLECAFVLKYYLELEMLLNDSVLEKKIRMDILLQIGQACYLSAHYRKTLEYTQKAEKIALEFKDQSAEASCCTNLGNAYFRLGKYKKAIDYFEKALEISSAIRDQSRIATNTGNLGTVYLCLGEYQKAIDYLEKGLEISSAIEDQSGIARNTGNLGTVYRSLGKYKKAIDYFEKGLEISSAIGDHSGIARNTGNLGNAYFSLGEYQKAIDYLEKGLKSSSAIGDRLGIANNTGNLGNAYVVLGEYQKAIDHFEEGLENSNAIGYQLGIAQNTGNLGNAYFSLGEYKKAIDYFKKSLKIGSAIRDPSGIASDTTNLGNAYLFLGEYQKAIGYFEKGLEITSAIGDQLGRANNTGNLGNAYLFLGEYQKAIGYFENGLAINSALGHQTGVASNNSNLGIAYLRLGNHRKAITFLMKGLEITIKIGDVNIESRCLAGIGYVYFCEGESKIEQPEAFSIFQKAMTFYKKSVCCRDQIFSTLDVDENQMSFTNEYFECYVKLMHCFIFLQRIEAALLAIDLGKAKALHASMEKRIKAKSDSSVDLTWEKINNNEEKKRIKELHEFLEMKSNNSSVLLYAFDKDAFLNIWVINGEDDVKFFKKIEPLEEFIFACLQTLFIPFRVSVNRDSTFSKLDLDSAFVWQTLALAQLDRKQATSKFDDATKQAKGGSNFGTSNNAHSPKHKTDESKLSDNTTEAVDSRTNILRKLFQVLIEPVKGWINGKKIVIVPHKFLFFVPFCSLLDENGCKVSHSYSIQVTPSLHTVVSSMTRSRDRRLNYALFVGNPTVNVTFRGNVPKPLPNALEEVKCLAPLFEAAPLLESNATKERVLKFIQGASIIHIAAHGTPEHGEILLAPNLYATGQSLFVPEEDSYLLKQQDIVHVDINARLVVLSCCHTGQGKISSEGVIGLTRAFLVAGARSVLATLWPINDKGTKEFMQIFYDKICKGTSVCEALRKTMNIFQRHRIEFFRSFDVWAQFTIYGEDVSFTPDDIEEIKRKSREMSF